jgi:hypothetical protein
MPRYYIPTSRGRRVVHSYSTAFPGTENPLLQNGTWLNGLRDGLDWLDLRMTPGLAFATGVSPSPPYNDPTAIVNGSWSPNQEAFGHVRTVNQQAFNQEIELRLRTSIRAHSISGYEILFRLSGSSGWYTDIVRWNGPLNDFDALAHVTTGPGVQNGDFILARISGDIISVYINGALVNSHDISTDTTPASGAGPAKYTNGSPGMGCFQHGQTTATLPDFGWTDWTGQDL